jgi:hypothetical protein
VGGGGEGGLYGRMHDGLQDINTTAASVPASIEAGSHSERMVAYFLVPVIALAQLSLAGGHAVPGGGGSLVPTHSNEMDAATEAASGGGRRRATAPGRHWEVDKKGVDGREAQEEEEDREGESMLFGEQKRFLRPAEEERREKFAMLRERNMRDQERRRHQRQLTQAQKEYRQPKHRSDLHTDISSGGSTWTES